MTPNERFSVLVAFFIACILLGILCAPLGAKADEAQVRAARALVTTSSTGRAFSRRASSPRRTCAPRLHSSGTCSIRP